MGRVVPFAAKVVALDVDARHRFIPDSDALRLGIGVEFAAYPEAGAGACRADQVDDDAVADQRLGTPVHGDE